MRTLPRCGKTSQFVRSRRAVIRPAKVILLERLKVRLGSRLCKNVVPLAQDWEPSEPGGFEERNSQFCDFDRWREA